MEERRTREVLLSDWTPLSFCDAVQFLALRAPGCSVRAQHTSASGEEAVIVEQSMFACRHP